MGMHPVLAHSTYLSPSDCWVAGYRETASPNPVECDIGNSSSMDQRTVAGDCNYFFRLQICHRSMESDFAFLGPTSLPMDEIYSLLLYEIGGEDPV